MNKKEKLILTLLAAVNFTHMLDFMIMLPLDNYLIPEFHISPKQFGFLVGAYSFTAAISGFTAAFFVDQFDRKKILVLAYIGFIAGTFTCGFSTNYEILMGARIFTGIFGGLIGAQVMAIIADLFAYERRGVATGVVMSSFAVAATLGIPFSIYLSEVFSWQAPFLLVGIIGIAIIPLLIKYIPAVSGHLVKKNKSISRSVALKHVLQSRQQVLALLFSVVVMIGHFLIIPFVNPFLEFNKGYSKDHRILFYLIGGIASFIAAIVLGKIADRSGKLMVFSITVILSCFAIWGVTNLPSLSFYSALAIITAWFIFGTGRAVTGQAMISNIVPPEQRGSFMTFNSSMQQLGTFLASVLAGFIVIEDRTRAGRIIHYDRVGYISIIFLFLSFLFARYLFSSMEKKEIGALDVAELKEVDEEELAPESA